MVAQVIGLNLRGESGFFSIFDQFPLGVQFVDSFVL